MLSHRQKEQISEYFKTQPVDGVYLFGSQVTSRANHLSDYDFGVVFQEKLSRRERFQRRLQFVGEVGKILKSNKVELVDFESVPLRFRYEIIAPKQEVMVQDRSRLNELEIQTVKHFLDMKPYLLQASQRKMELLAQKGF